ncbi:hypothetical protein M231_01307 [Tremella mesenterica]|uniref:Mid2 domain-containing protein n=1 Tax=Tremella mesenterica TaxID=5217 RepID=A0A4Q1BTW4_TREME|nr:hypothetical protein M231_01307 [Tremella mesenterica]
MRLLDTLFFPILLIFALPSPQDGSNIVDVLSGPLLDALSNNAKVPSPLPPISEQKRGHRSEDSMGFSQTRSSQENVFSFDEIEKMGKRDDTYEHVERMEQRQLFSRYDSSDVSSDFEKRGQSGVGEGSSEGWLGGEISQILDDLQVGDIGSQGNAPGWGGVGSPIDVAEGSLGLGDLEGLGSILGGSVKEVVETQQTQISSAGTTTVHCITDPNDPSQENCQTTHNGQAVSSGLNGGGSGSSESSMGSSSTSSGGSSMNSDSSSSSSSSHTGSNSSGSTSSSNNSGSTGSISNTTSNKNTDSTTTSDTSSSTITSTTSIKSVDAVVNAPATVTTSSASLATLGTDPQTTSSVDAVVNDPIAATTSTTTTQDGPTLITPTDSITVTPTSSVEAAAANAATSSSTNSTQSAQQDNATAAAVVIPGQHMQVLPIGLGIFGGLTALTLIIVGYVMYERRKYKGQFRKRKLAEKGAPMGTSQGVTYGTAV